MGAINSACECFLGEKSDTKTPKASQKPLRDSHVYHTMAETRSETIEYKSSPSKQAPLSFNSVTPKRRSSKFVLKSPKPNSLKLRDQQSINTERDRKLTIKDFELLKVCLTSDRILILSRYLEKDLLVKFTLLL